MRTVATAGHVDHGKSTLVLALTGTDPDRFPQEKARGLTIDLGFAFFTLADGEEVGFVDVPGHTRFVKNMLAGAGAVEICLLVVAANEGWMPQSEEHLRILDGLGVRHGVVVLTKADLATQDLLKKRTIEVREHLEGTGLADAPIVSADSRSGNGLDDVRVALAKVLAESPVAIDRGRPRLWIDRVFASRGAGTVVTGTLAGGRFNIGADVIAGGFECRLRGIESAGLQMAAASPGARVALNLSGVDYHALRRGDAVVLPEQWIDVVLVDVAVQELPGESLADRSRLTAHVGSGEHHVLCRLLGEDHRFARLWFNEALPIAPGDRIVLRDPGRQTTTAGAVVLTIAPTNRSGDAAAVLAQPIAHRLLATGWVPVAGITARTGLNEDEAADKIREAGGVRLRDWYLDSTTVARLRNSATRNIEAHQVDSPNSPGLTTHELARELALEHEHLLALIDSWDEVVVDHGCVRVAASQARVGDSPEGRALIATLDSSPFAPPPPEDLAIARALVREGSAVDLDGIYFSSRAVSEARSLVITALGERRSVTVAEIRDILGSTRKYVLPIVAHLDRIGVTRRRGDDRIAGPTSGLL